MRTNRMITAGALALALALAAAQNACANLASAPKDLREAPQDPQEVQEALQGEWEVSWEETLKPQFEQDFKKWNDKALRTRLAILKVNPEGMNRKQMEEEYTKAVVEAGRGTGQMARVIHTFSGNIMTTDIIAPDGVRTTMESDPFTVDGTAINWNKYSDPYTLQDNTLTLDIKGRKMIFHKVE